MMWESLVQELFSAVVSNNFRAFILIVIGFAIVAVGRSVSVRAGHSTWFVAVVACLLFPVLSRFLPSFPILVIPNETLDPFRIVNGAESVVGSGLLGALVVIYFGVGLCSFMAFLSGVRRVFKLEQHMRLVSDRQITEIKEELCRAMSIRRHVTLISGELIDTPMTWGVLQPRIALPSSALTWPQSRIRNALLHELHHVRRFDWFRLCVLRLAGSMYWINPALWFAVKSSVFESEVACDELVLRSDGRPTDYAQHIVDIASGRHDVRRLMRSGVAMSDTNIPTRVQGILAFDERKAHPGPSGALLFLVLVLTTAAMLSACQVNATYQSSGKPEVSEGARMPPPRPPDPFAAPPPSPD